MTNFSQNYTTDDDIIKYADVFIDKILKFPANITESQLDFRQAIQLMGRIMELLKIQNIGKDGEIVLEKAVSCTNTLVSLNNVQNIN